MGKRRRGGWGSSIVDALRRETTTEKIFYVVAAVALLTVPFYWLERYDRFLYWAQVVSGNWPGKTPGVGGWEFAVSIVLALILNLFTIGAVLGGLTKIIFLERKIMEVREALALKDLVVRNHVLNRLAETISDTAEREKISATVAEALKEGQANWLRKYLPIAVPNREDREKLERQFSK